MTIVSIQSEVAYGYVGNSIARPAWQYLAHEVVALPSIFLSCHKGYGDAAVLSAPLDIEAALQAVMPRLDWSEVTLVSGFLASEEQGRALARFIEAHPPKRYVLDPVMGDEEPGLYVPEALVATFKQELLPLADAVCLNAFECRQLFGSVEAGLSAGMDMVVTSVLADDKPDRLAVMAKLSGEAYEVEAPKLRRAGKMPNGLGDLSTALLADGLIKNEAPDHLASRIASTSFSMLEQSLNSPRRELDLPKLLPQLSQPSTSLPLIRADYSTLTCF